MLDKHRRKAVPNVADRQRGGRERDGEAVAGEGRIWAIRSPTR